MNEQATKLVLRHHCVGQPVVVGRPEFVAQSIRNACAVPGTIIRPILLRQAPLTALRYVGEIIGVPGMRLPSLLDPRPFADAHIKFGLPNAPRSGPGVNATKDLNVHTIALPRIESRQRSARCSAPSWATLPAPSSSSSRDRSRTPMSRMR